MNVRICDIVTEIVGEGTYVPDCVHQMLASWVASSTDAELLKGLREVRSLMLDIILRIQPPDRVKRETLLAADQFWDGSQRAHFAEAAEKLIADPTVVTYYESTLADEDQPLNDFIDGIGGDQDLAAFVWNQLAGEKPAPDIRCV